MISPRRLIEVDLPIRAISTHARREKSIRHGHISTLHIWWARRPLAACRAVLCAALWPDPLDETCPLAFREAVALTLAWFAEQARTNAEVGGLVADHWSRWVRTNTTSLRATDPACWPDLRYALLDFIADFANWDASTVPAFLETARILTHVAHLSMTIDDFRLKINPADSLPVAIENMKSQIEKLPRPLVVDPFAGGGSIPLEALRIGADAFASDLNPVAVLLNKVVLEYIPKYGNTKIEFKDANEKLVVLNGLAEAVRYWGNRIKEQAEKELAEFYPKDPDGATPIAYLWARTITCEGPGCGTEVPLMRSFWLAKKGERSVALQIIPDQKNKCVDFEIIEKRGGKWVCRENPQSEFKNPQLENGTVRRGSATCPVCGYTTPVERVRVQLKTRHGGANDARLFAVVTTRSAKQGHFYRMPNERDLLAVKKAATELERRKTAHTGLLSIIPDEPLPPQGALGFRVQLYGMEKWGDLFSCRQALALETLVHLLQNVEQALALQNDNGVVLAIKILLAFAIDRQADYLSSLVVWANSGEFIAHTFGRQALPIVWEWPECNPWEEGSGNWAGAIEWISRVVDANMAEWKNTGHVESASATRHPLPNDSTQCVFTDPPYYDAVAYADLSDFFVVWLRRSLQKQSTDLFLNLLSPKEDECIVDEIRGKDKTFFENTMMQAMSEGRRILAPDGIGVVVFANKSTTGWEAQLQAMLNAGWIVTGSWPIDTERPGRLRAQKSAALASSIHLVCRPRPDAEQNQSSIENLQSKIENVGDWRDVLAELPARIHAWLPRLAAEGVVGADAIFACLGPALEIFSRYSRVEKASGESVTLKEYLEVVWAAVAREALGIIFSGADATGFEEDARLTAMWLWTLNAGNGASKAENSDDEVDDTAPETRPAAVLGSYALEYDAARKLAQGLGAHLEKLTGLIEVKGDQARLLPVRERRKSLLGKDDDARSARKKDSPQMTLFEALPVTGAATSEEPASAWLNEPALHAGVSVLDRLHQSMLLFADGQSAALKRFLVEDGIGKDQRLWRLADALSALYPSGSDEKRWVDGVLGKKKGLGF